QQETVPDVLVIGGHGLACVVQCAGQVLPLVVELAQLEVGRPVGGVHLEALLVQGHGLGPVAGEPGLGGLHVVLERLGALVLALGGHLSVRAQRGHGVRHGPRTPTGGQQQGCDGCAEDGAKGVHGGVGAQPRVLSSLRLRSRAWPRTCARRPIMLLATTASSTRASVPRIEFRTTLPVITLPAPTDTWGPTTLLVSVTFSPMKHGSITTLF